MNLYRTKPKYIEAVEIDNKWATFLISKGYTDFAIGDFFLRTHTGQESIWPRMGFLSIYEEVGNE